jgi:hypothetical protein
MREGEYKVPKNVKSLGDYLKFRNDLAWQIILFGEAFYDLETGEFYQPGPIASDLRWVTAHRPRKE